MEYNAKLLYESTQDSFPERTYEASVRIYDELGKTWDRTFGMMKKFVDMFVADDDDDHRRRDDDNSGSGGPKRR